MSGNIILANNAASGLPIRNRQRAMLFHDFNLTEGRHSKTGSFDLWFIPSLPQENNFISLCQRTLN